MKKILALVLFIISPLSIAQIAVGVDYINLEQNVTAENTEFSANLSAIAIVVGYSFQLPNNITFTPELSYGVGVGKDKENLVSGNCTLCDVIRSADVELDSIIKLSTKFSYGLNSNLNIFASPTFYYSDYSANVSNFSASDEINFGVDFGGEIIIGQKWIIQAAFGLHQDNDFWSVGVRYQF